MKMTTRQAAERILSDIVEASKTGKGDAKSFALDFLDKKEEYQVKQMVEILQFARRNKKIKSAEENLKQIEEYQYHAEQVMFDFNMKQKFSEWMKTNKGTA